MTAITSASTLSDQFAPCTEIITVHLLPHINIPSHPAHLAQFNIALDRVRQAPGFLGCRWGLRVEKDLIGGTGEGSGAGVGTNTVDDAGLPGLEVLELVIDWENFKAHEELMAAEDYIRNVITPMTRDFSTGVEILHFFPGLRKGEENDTTAAAIKNVERDVTPPTDRKEGPEPGKPSIPVLEICTWNIKRYISFSKFLAEHVILEDALSKAEGMKGVNAGKVLEKENIAVLMVGWESVDAHLDWKKGNEAQKAIGKVRDMVDKVVMHHICILGEVSPEKAED